MKLGPDQLLPELQSSRSKDSNPGENTVNSEDRDCPPVARGERICRKWGQPQGSIAQEHYLGSVAYRAFHMSSNDPTIDHILANFSNSFFFFSYV